jgi:hypothetical protein
MSNDRPRTVLESWPVIREDFKVFMSDRPGWLIGALEKACKKKGSSGWRDVERVIEILQFLKDTEVEYY